ncbi:hypothetical protein AOX55_00006082 (plasmid) [Sinorhizobium fredii CCBAU 25509]|nr:hypothetical protein SF83666_b60730 [Sinorhizobium fredii CCBAU 83666]AWM28857.1 hypothetical protein AOX55_00006082 [Sinorhizobium fredii CCBAU 25509]
MMDWIVLSAWFGRLLAPLRCSAPGWRLVRFVGAGLRSLIW